MMIAITTELEILYNKSEASPAKAKVSKAGAASTKENNEGIAGLRVGSVEWDNPSEYAMTMTALHSQLGASAIAIVFSI